MISQGAAGKFGIIRKECIDDCKVLFGFLHNKIKVRASLFEETIPSSISDGANEQGDTLQFICEELVSGSFSNCIVQEGIGFFHCFDVFGADGR